jgi:hypothetical protein
VKSLGAGEGAQFRPADLVSIGGSATPVAVIRVSGDTLRLAADPSPAAAGGDAVILASVAAGARTLRLDGLPNPLPVNGLVPGSILTVDATAQAGGGPTPRSSTRCRANSWAVVPSPTRHVPRGTPHRLQPRPADAAVTLQSEEFALDVTQGAVTTPTTTWASTRSIPATCSGAARRMARV